LRAFNPQKPWSIIQGFLVVSTIFTPYKMF
jgi:hypothetical protein